MTGLMLLMAGAAWSQVCPIGFQNTQPIADYDTTQNGGQTALHTRTGFTWMRCAVGQTWTGATCTGTATNLNWQAALQAAAAETTLGGGWRVPNVRELESIVESACFNNRLNNAVFLTSPASSFWTSTTYAFDSSRVWAVVFNSGDSFAEQKSGLGNVRLVRGGDFSADFDVVTVTPAVTGVQSRKVHGSAGTFGIAIDTTQPIAGAVTVEPRAIGSGHLIAFTFDRAITSAGTATSSGGGTATATFAGNEVTVRITNLADNKRSTITLQNVNGIAAPAPVSLGFLIGDADNSRSVTASDVSGLRIRSGQAVDAGNFRYDLNASGSIGAADIAAAKRRAGTNLR